MTSRPVDIDERGTRDLSVDSRQVGTTGGDPDVPVVRQVIERAGIRIDQDNSTQTPLADGESFTGGWTLAEQFGTISFFAFTAGSNLTTARLEWSSDGVSVNTDLLATADYQTSEDDGTAGFWIYYPDPSTYLLDKYFRLVLANDSGTDQTLLSAYLWTFPHGAQPFTFVDLDGELGTLAKALLTRSVLSGENPDGGFGTASIQGRHAANSTSTPLGPDGVFRGEWLQWQEKFKKMVVDLESDVAGTLFIDFAQDAEPVDGDDTSVVESLEIAYDPAVTPLLRRSLPVQSRWVRTRYVNGLIPQAEVELDTAFLESDSGLVLSPMGSRIKSSFLAGHVKSVGEDVDDNGDYQPHTMSPGGGARRSIVEHEVDTPIKAKTTWGVRGTPVGSTGAVQLARPDVTGVGTYEVQNEGSAAVFMARTEADTAVSTLRRRIYATGSTYIDVDESGEMPWCLSEDTGGAVNEDRLLPTTATGGTDPSNVLTSNDSRATVATGETLEADGYLAQRLLDGVSQVVIGFEGRISASSPATETVAFVDDVRTSGGNVGSLTTGTVTSNEDHFYKATTTTRNTAAQVNSVTGLGLTWTLIDAGVDDNDRVRIEVWRGTGTPTGDGTVQAIFNETATNCTLRVSRWSGVDLSDPVENMEKLDPAGTVDTYSDSIDGTDKGMIVTHVGMRRRTHTPGGGYTELTKLNTGTGNNDTRQSVSYDPLTSTGSKTYLGTFDANADFVVVAVTLTPRPIDNPTVVLSYEVDGTPGETSAEVEVTSGTDTEYTLNVTADREWTFNDVDGISVLVDGTDLNAAIVGIDTVFVDEEEAESGVTQLVTVTAVGDV